MTETVTLRCLECPATITVTADEPGQRKAYDIGWHILRAGQLCPVHSQQWLDRRRKRREKIAEEP